ncbi:MAG: hypothetical protein AB7I30_09140 [Isosphaeraceae bacterium]
MQPVPTGFRNVSSYPDAGMRVNRSDDRAIAAIQFAEDRRASRDGLQSEIDTLEIRGFRYEPLRRQWEREDREQPGANIVDAAQLGAELARARMGRTVG